MRRRCGTGLLLSGSMLLGACGGTSAGDVARAATSGEVVADSDGPTSTLPAPSPGNPAAKARLARASTSIADAGTVRFELVETISTPLGTVEVSGSGQVDAKAGRQQLTLDLGGLGGLTGETDGGEPQTVEVRIVDGSVYLHYPYMAQVQGTAPEWVRLPPGAEGLAETPVGGPDPAGMLAILNGGEPEIVGTEDVRGVSTTHYHGEFDAESAVRDLPPDQQAKATDALAALPAEPTPVDVWIGDDGLARRLQLSLDLARVPDGGPVAITLEFFDYGAPVTIEAPADFVDGGALGPGLGLGPNGRPGR